MTSQGLTDSELIQTVRERLEKLGVREDQHLAQMMGMTKGGLSLMRKRLETQGTPISKQARYGLEALHDIPDALLRRYTRQRIE